MSAYTLKHHERLYPRALAVAGFVGCLVLAFSLPISSVLIGSAVMLVGIPAYLLARYRRQ
ncbi:MAG: Putative amino acid transporter [Methanomicrobiales archaeon 53_19]|nr:MAG: Putative amino acid transporter [Methanomicrobiales archaeon 53_19]